MISPCASISAFSLQVSMVWWYSAALLPFYLSIWSSTSMESKIFPPPITPLFRSSSYYSYPSATPRGNSFSQLQVEPSLTRMIQRQLVSIRRAQIWGKQLNTTCGDIPNERGLWSREPQLWFSSPGFIHGYKHMWQSKVWKDTEPLDGLEFGLWLQQLPVWHSGGLEMLMVSQRKSRGKRCRGRCGLFFIQMRRLATHELGLCHTQNYRSMAISLVGLGEFTSYLWSFIFDMIFPSIQGRVQKFHVIIGWSQTVLRMNPACHVVFISQAHPCCQVCERPLSLGLIWRERAGYSQMPAEKEET